MRRTIQIVTCLLILILGVTKSPAQITLKSKAKSLVGIEVHFRWDDSRLDLDYMGNTQAFSRFAHVVDSVGLLKIDSIIVVSQSSPEGPYERNMRLSQRRAATMRHAIVQRHPELKDLLRVHPDGESWMQLREYVEHDTILGQEAIDEILSVIDSDVDIAIKKKRMDQLPSYRYLYKTYYPRIRNSVFCIVYYDIPLQMAQMPAPVEAPALIDSLAPIPMVYRAEQPREPVLNVRTNLLYDMGTVLNVGIEYYPRNSRWSVVGHYTFPWWSNDKYYQYLQILDWDLEARYYMQRGKRHAGWYVAPYVHWNLYDISLNAELGWQGEGRGCGISLGHAFRLGDSQRWKVECFLRFGVYQTLFDPYHASDPFNGKYYYDWDWAPEFFVPRNHKLLWMGPTGAGVTVSYDLFKRKQKAPRSSRISKTTK